MKKTLLLANIALLCACSEQRESFLPDVENKGNSDGVVMTIPEFVVSEEDATTRTLLTPSDDGICFSWIEGDKVGIYTESSTVASFDVDQISQNAKSATFDGGGFRLSKTTLDRLCLFIESQHPAPNNSLCIKLRNV